MDGTMDSGTWRSDNIGRMLFSATDVFVRDKLRTVRAAGFTSVTEAQVALFQNLDLEGTRMTVIAARAHMTKQSMLELVNKAAAQGLVARRDDPDDRRAKIIAFTPAGLEALEHLRHGVTEAERRMAEAAGADLIVEMKTRLSAYVLDRRPGDPGHAMMPSDDAAWRTDSIGRVLFWATDIFVSDILHSVHAAGFEVKEVLLTLFRNLDLEGTRLTDIAIRARMTKQAMLELVDQAEALGMVERRPDPADGRAKVVAFTVAGRHLLDILREGVLAAEQAMADAVGTPFVAEMKTQLAHYVASAEDADSFGTLPVPRRARRAA